MSNNLIRDICYEKFGSLSKMAYNIFRESKNFNNLHSLCFDLGISYKFIKDVLINLCEISGDEYTILNEYKSLDVDDKTNSIDYSKELANITDIISKFTSHKMDLDHVSAIPETLLKRAEYLINNHDVEYSKLLFLGDHDFTSIATAYILKQNGITNYQISVLDIDDDILDFISKVSKQLDLNIKVMYADFRVGVPIICHKKFDVIFTDPPYTPEGMKLFLTRAIECAKDKNSTIYLCYKSAELSPSIGYQVQRELDKCFIYFKEIISNFNSYYKAEALGYRSNLYVCSILPKAFENIECSNNYDIYTHGQNALETKNVRNIDYNYIIDFVKSKENATDIKLISNEKVPNQDTVLLSTYYKQKETKTLNHSKDSVYILDFTYQFTSVLGIRTLIMSNKQTQYGVLRKEQLKQLNNNMYSTILNLYNTEILFSNDVYSIVKFSLKPSIEDSPLGILIYKNSNIKNSFMHTATLELAVTKNEARTMFSKFKSSCYGDNFIFELSYFNLDILRNEILNVFNKNKKI